MAKRKTGITNRRPPKARKTKKRLAIKNAMLEAKKAKKGAKNKKK